MNAIKKVINNLLICLFLLCTPGMFAQNASIKWNEDLHPCTAADINVGSSQCTDIIIYFEVQDADITNGKVVITLPNLNGETFNLTDFPVGKLGGSVDLGAATVSGNTLTFPAVNLFAGSAVYYRIPRYASAQSNAVYTDDQTLSIRVYRDDQSNIATNGTKNVKYKYRYATLQLLDPLPMPENQSSGRQMDFGVNNAVHSASPDAQEFQFQMACSGGAVDSATIFMTFSSGEITLSDWEVDNKLLDYSQITVTSRTTAPFTTTYTVKIRKDDFPGGKGIGAGESVPVSVKVLKDGCGTADVSYTSSWATAANIKTAYDVTTAGAFNASPGSGMAPALKSVAYKSTLPNGMICLKNSTNTNIFTYTLTNTGQGAARNIKIYNTAAYSSYLDTANIFIRKNYAGNPEKAKKITVTGTLSTGAITNPLYSGLPNEIHVDVSQTLSANAQDTLYIDIPFVVLADYYIYQKGVNHGNTNLPYVRYNIPFYTNDCGDEPYSMTTNTTHYPTGDGWNGISTWDNITSFSSGETKKFSVSEMRMAMFDRPAMAKNDARVVFEIALPKGLELKDNKASDISVYKKGDPESVWPVTNFYADVLSSADSNFYAFELLRNNGNGLSFSYTSYVMDFMLENTCPVYENRTLTGEIRTKIYPTGVVNPGDCNDVVYDGLQIYPTFITQCAKEGVTYSFDRKRLTVGWRDDNNAGLPDDTSPANPSLINHDYVLVNDTLQYTWTGEVLENGNKVLYAVLFSSINQGRMVPVENGIPSVLTLDGNSNGIQSVLKNTVAGGIINAYDRGTGVPATERYAYVWEITKTNESTFLTGNKIIFSMLVTATSTYSNISAANYNMNNWLYAAEDKLGNIPNILSPGNARKGNEEYPFSYLYSSPYWYVAPPAFSSFSSPGEKEANPQVNIHYIHSNALAPYEYRHLSTVDSVVIQVPEGYIIANNINFRIDDNNSALVSASSLHTNLPYRKTFVIGSDVFDVNRNDPTKLPLPDGAYNFQPYPLKISATNSSPTGVTQGNITYYADAHTYTQAYIPRLEKFTSNSAEASSRLFDLTYNDPGSLKLSVVGLAVKEALSSTVSWNINLQNTKSDGDAYSAWLYVQGPVSNASLQIGAVNYPGFGEGNRWIKLPAILKGTTISGTLSVEYASTDCNDQTVNLYPIFDRTQVDQDAWTPANGGITMTDTGFTAAQQGGAGFDYIYSKLALTIQNVASRIGGSITALAATPADPANPLSGTYNSDRVAVDDNFPLEVVFSTMGANGPVVNTRATLTVPAGLEYVANSAYMEIGSTNYPVQPGSSFITELEKLTGDDTGKVLNLDLSQTGIAALGSNGQLLGTTDTYLRFRLKPTCDISPSSPRITVSFTGDRLCGTAATGSGVQTFSSSPLTLTGTIPSFNVDMSNSTISLSTFDCDSEATLTLRFKKISGPSAGISDTDSLRVAVPKAIRLKEGAGITYNLPAGWQNRTPAQTGQTVAAPTINDRIEGEYRLITWPMPEAYFDDLGNNGEGVQIAAAADNEYTIPLQFAQSADYFNGDMRVAIVTGSRLGENCQANSAESDAYPIKAVAKATSTTWQGNVDDDWANDANWSNGVPGTCTDVEISESATFFPALTDTTARVNSIHFPFGTEIGGIPYLNYNRATVDLTVTSNRWYLLSSPFMDMYSGDYILGSTRNNPAVYIRRYQSEDLFSGAAKKIASWTSSFGQTNIPLTPGTGYAIWVATDVTEPRTFDFPKDSTSYAVYNKGGTSVAYTENIPSRANSYRFAFYDKFDQSNDKNNRSFDMAVENGSETAYTNLLIANPFMSHLDFSAFYTANSNKINNAFYVWNGSSFTATNQTPAEAESYGSSYIAPQQSFVVLRNGSTNVSTLRFTPEMSVANVGNGLRSAGSARSPRLQLKVYRYGVLQSEAEIRYQPDASNGFEDFSDAWTLFAEDVKKTAVLYSLVDNAAASINTIGSLNEDIPLGIRTSEPGELKFEITGAESFDGDVYLIDVAKGGQAIQLETSTEYAFNNTTGDIIDRFYIRILGTNTGINDETTAHGILIYQENSVLYVKSDLSDPLRSVELYDAQGRVLVKHAASTLCPQQPSPSSPIFLKSSKTLKSQPSQSGTVGAVGMVLETSCALPIPGDERMIVVKVVSEKSQTVKKLFIK